MADIARYKDLTGQQFGELTVVEKTNQRLHGEVAWKCKCSCGKEILVRGYSLKSGATTSCHDPIHTEMNMIGKTFGQLTIIHRVGEIGNKSPKWLCKCTCGNEVVKTTYALKHGKEQNCGAPIHTWIDILGSTINELTVVSLSDKQTIYNGNINPYYNCVCSCGEKCQVSRKSLLGNHVKSCGHLRTVNDDDFIGKKFGRLTPIARIDSESTPPKYLCKCDCGNQCVSISTRLNNKHYRSCGCYVAERLKEMNRKYNNVVYHDDYIELFDSFGNSTKLLHDDYEKVKNRYWFMNSGGYFQSATDVKNGPKRLSLHRFLMNLDQNDKRVVDHINGDTTDNRRDNLRICTVTENVHNSKTKSTNKTGIPGVSKRNNVYDVAIQQQHIGVAKTLEEAAVIRYKAEIERFGKFVRGDWYKNFEEVLKNVST